MYSASTLAPKPPVVVRVRAVSPVYTPVCQSTCTAMAAASSSGAAGSSQMAESLLDVDGIIAKLLEVRGSRPGKQVNLTEAEIRSLCTASREIFMQQPVLLELEAPIKICGTQSSYDSPERRTLCSIAHSARMCGT